jgi:hypothetical protein
MIGAGLDEAGSVHRYPELSTFSFSSADETSVYSNAYWTKVDDRGARDAAGAAGVGRCRTCSTSISRARRPRRPAGTPRSRFGDQQRSVTTFPPAFRRAHRLGGDSRVRPGHWKRTGDPRMGSGTARRSVSAGSRERHGGSGLRACGWKIPPVPRPYAYQFKAVGDTWSDCPYALSSSSRRRGTW